MTPNPVGFALVILKRADYMENPDYLRGEAIRNARLYAQEQGIPMGDREEVAVRSVLPSDNPPPKTDEDAVVVEVRWS